MSAAHSRAGSRHCCKQPSSRPATTHASAFSRGCRSSARRRPMSMQLTSTSRHTHTHVACMLHACCNIHVCCRSFVQAACRLCAYCLQVCTRTGQRFAAASELAMHKLELAAHDKELTTDGEQVPERAVRACRASVHTRALLTLQVGRY